MINLQSQIERSCLFVFQPLSHHQNTAIMELVCRFLAGKGHGSLQIYCSQFCGNQTLCQCHSLYSWDPAEHLVLLTTAILSLWTDLSTAGWLLLLTFGMSSQLI